MNIIYTITTIPHDFPFRESRCVGWFEKPSDAFEILRYNRGDIYEEGHYRFAVVEQVGEGIYNFPREEFWFEWSQDRRLDGSPTPGYQRLDRKPNRFNNIACWAIG